jgi:AcrR family transcriptional regulator
MQKNAAHEEGSATIRSTVTFVPTQRERNAETRRRLLSAAREVFAEKGYHHASVADIVKRAARAHGSFYLHYPNKEAVLRALLEEAMTHLSLELKTLWRWHEPDTDVHKTILKFIQAYGEDQDLWLLLDQRSTLDPAVKKLSDQWFRLVATSIMRGMIFAQTPALMPGIDPEILAQVLAAMLIDSTRAFYQEDSGWTLNELADEIATTWSLTLGYHAASPSPADTA